MRTDAIIDKRQVKIPNASHLGYDKWVAQVGDVLTYRSADGEIRTGRMIGRVVSAPACGETPAITNWILVLQLDSNLSHAYERWIDPAWVQSSVAPTGFAEFLAYFMGPTLPTGQNGRYIAHHGSLTVHHEDGPYYDGATTIQEHIDKVMARRDAQFAGTWKA